MNFTREKKSGIKPGNYGNIKYVISYSNSL